MRVVHATTVPQTLGFLTGQCADLARRGAEVVLVSAPGQRLWVIARSEGVRAEPVEMAREISPLADARALFQIIQLLRRLRPDVVHAHTPKAGLLFTAAARLARVPVCIYHIHGLRFLTTTGIRRRLLKAAERASCMLAHSVLGVSSSVLELARAEGVLPQGTGIVLRSGSVNGVDSSAFSPSRARDRAESLRAGLGIGTDDPVIGFVGRLVVDKGLVELAEAWKRIRSRIPHARLLVVGSQDDTDPLPAELHTHFDADPRVHLIGDVADVLPYFGLMSVLALPSYREGFGQVLLEAAACRIAVVASDIPGIRDAVVDAGTGLLVPAGDVEALADALTSLLEDPDRREGLAVRARQRAESEFHPADLWQASWDHDQALLASVRRPRRSALRIFGD